MARRRRPFESATPLAADHDQPPLELVKRDYSRPASIEIGHHPLGKALGALVSTYGIPQPDVRAGTVMRQIRISWPIT
jgi:hypothetical protein